MIFLLAALRSHAHGLLCSARGEERASHRTEGAVRLAAASRPLQENSLEYVDKWVNWGAGLRAAQFLVLGAKARALLLGATHVTVEDVQALASPVLRHRILVNYRAEAEGITTEKVIEHLLETIPSEIK